MQLLHERKYLIQLIALTSIGHGRGLGFFLLFSHSIFIHFIFCKKKYFYKILENIKRKIFHK